MTNSTELKPCIHNKRIRKMYWPDGGESWLCDDCLLTKHHTEDSESEWQNHSYKSPADWYQEAADLQKQIDDILKLG